MGGRGGASSIQAQSLNSITKEKIANKAEIEKKLPSVGGGRCKNPISTM